jgi:integrase
VSNSPNQIRRERLFLTAEKVKVLPDASPDQFQTLMYVMAYCGLRWGEAVALRQERVDVLRGRLRVTESLFDEGGKLHFGPTKNYQQQQQQQQLIPLNSTQIHRTLMIAETATERENHRFMRQPPEQGHGSGGGT